MIHKICCNAKQRHKNHRNNPGQFKLVATIFIHHVNHEACRKNEGKPKVKLKVLFKTKNKKGQYKNLYCDEKKVDYEAAVNASIKKLEPFFVLDIVRLFFCFCFHFSEYNKANDDFCQYSK